MADEWHQARFSEICEESVFGPRFSGEFYATDGNVATLRTTDISKDGRIEYSTMPLARLDLSRLRQHILHENDLVITRSGRVGTVAVFEGFRLPVLPGAFLIRFRLKREVSDPRFYRYYFNSPTGQELLLSVATGSVQQNLNITSLHGLYIPVPSLAEQHAISRILGSFDEKIELNRRMNETLGAMAHAIFKSWFVDFDPVRAKAQGREPAGMDAETAGLFPDSFEERELGMVPKGWETKLLGQITCYINRGIQPKYIDNDGITVINQKCIRDHRIDWTKARRHDPNFRAVNGRELQIGDLLMNSTGVGTLGRVAQILCLYERAIVDSHVTIVRADPKIITWNTLGLMLFTREAEIEDLGEGTTGQTELSRERLKSLKVLVPSLSAQKSFDKATLPLRDLIISNEIQMQALADIRDVLLPKLLSGEVRAKVAGE